MIWNDHCKGVLKRNIPTASGEPWFVLKDVCKVLSIGNVSDVFKRLDADEKGGRPNRHPWW